MGEEEVKEEGFRDWASVSRVIYWRFARVRVDMVVFEAIVVLLGVLLVVGDEEGLKTLRWCWW